MHVVDKLYTLWVINTIYNGQDIGMVPYQFTYYHQCPIYKPILKSYIKIMRNMAWLITNVQGKLFNKRKENNIRYSAASMSVFPIRNKQEM